MRAYERFLKYVNIDTTANSASSISCHNEAVLDFISAIRLNGFSLYSTLSKLTCTFIRFPSFCLALAGFDFILLNISYIQSNNLII